MSGRLEGKVAVVSGGARGLGAEIGRLFAREGAAVLLGDIRDELGHATAAEIDAAEPGTVRFSHLDVTVAADWAAAVERAERELGPLTTLVSNAFKWPMGNVLTVTDEAWHETLAIQLDGAFYGIRAALPAMQRNGGGSIIAIASAVGPEHAAPDFAAYQAAKSGLVGLIRHVGGTFAGDGVRANSIHPGPIRTPALTDNGFEAGASVVASGFPIPRIAEPSEIAWAAVYLASDESSYMTANKIVIDGGSSVFVGSVEQGAAN
jgi:3alpha(or 20beta)-hydroxysteroid dehydrogenase